MTPTREQISNARKRPDGWPLCPTCDEDELFSQEVPATVESICGCYRCGWRLDA